MVRNYVLVSLLLLGSKSFAQVVEAMVPQGQPVAAGAQALTITQVIQGILQSYIDRYDAADTNILVELCKQMSVEVGQHGALIDAELGKLLEIFGVLRDIVALDLSQYAQGDLDAAAISELTAKKALIGRKVELLKGSLAAGQSQAQLVSFIFEGLDLGRLFTWTPEILEADPLLCLRAC